MDKPHLPCLIILLLLGVNLQSQKTMHYSKSNTRPVNTIEDAVIYKQVKKKSDNRYVLKTYHKAKDKWILTLIERIHTTENGEQTIKYKANNFFARRKIRSMIMIEPGRYAFV